VNARDQETSWRGVSSFLRSGLKRSRNVAEASELIEEDRVPIAEASTPAITRPARPVGRFSTMYFGKTSSKLRQAERLQGLTTVEGEQAQSEHQEERETGSRSGSRPA